MARIGVGLLAPLCLLAFPVLAQNGGERREQLSVEMYAVNLREVGDSRGRIVVTEFEHGLEFRPELAGLQPGLHGFHVHEYPDCRPGPVPDAEGKAPAMAAGGHWDPNPAGDHSVPWASPESGHFGDLPALYVDEKKVAEHPVFKPGMALADLRGHSLIVHHGGDAYSNQPDPMGGGGPAAVCGVIPEDN